MYQKLPLDLTKAQVNKLLKGGMIQLSPVQLQGKQHYILVHPSTHKKAVKAKRLGKGVRIMLTPDECECSGEGLKEFLEGVKKFGKKVIDSPIYQKFAKPIVRELVTKGEQLAKPFLGRFGDVAESYVEDFGKRTGAYGVSEELYGKIMDISRLIHPLAHPASNPVQLPPPGQNPKGAGLRKSIHAAKGKKGGSFKPTGPRGGSFKGV